MDGTDDAGDSSAADSDSSSADANRSRTGGDSSPTDSDRSPAEIVDEIDGPVLLFDGVCNLCHGTVRTIVKLDDDGVVLFAPLQSAVGTELLDRIGLDPDYFDSVVLVEDGENPGESRTGGEADGREAYTKSTAILRVCRYLDGPMALLYPLVYLPERLRDVVYDLVAEHRYRIFGKKEECPVPEPEIRRRFLERSLA